MYEEMLFCVPESPGHSRPFATAAMSAACVKVLMVVLFMHAVVALVTVVGVGTVVEVLSVVAIVAGTLDVTTVA